MISRKNVKFATGKGNEFNLILFPFYKKFREIAQLYQIQNYDEISQKREGFWDKTALKQY